jgi:superfamily II RNA helicase
MKFNGLTLDSFQVEAIRALEQQKTVVVSAATGTGKTVIAEFIIDECLKKTEKKVIYTAPIKALSNQKFRDFKAQYGEEYIGILTGDVVINPHAPILIMTTEIYRNMLLQQDPIIKDISYVVFDEIHFMNDPERGTVWEEAILFSPPNIRFLCLSATIPNAKEFASWLQTMRDHQVVIVTCDKRAVPLHQFMYDWKNGFVDRITATRFQQQKRSKRNRQQQPVSVGQIIIELDKKIPVIVFSFSRKQCEEEAKRLQRRRSFIKDAEMQKIIQETCEKYFSSEIQTLTSTKELLQALYNGIGFHHAGLLPQQRFAVEELFSKKVLPVLFATETFAVGVNMPAKTVILNGLRKFDGKRFRVISSKEYFQLAGRAGRRGIDTEGFVVTVLREGESSQEYVRISESDTEPIQSQFILSFNTVLNMIDSYSTQEIDMFLKMNFHAFRRQHLSHKQVRMKTSFTQRIKQLQRMGYLTDMGVLTEKGLFAKKIYFEEVLISELFATDLYQKLSDTELLQVIAGIVYEHRPNDYFSFHGIENNYQILLRKISSNALFMKNLNKLSLKRMMALVDVWSSNGSFQQIVSLTNYQEGDVVRLFRRIIDMIQQIRRASHEKQLKDRLATCLQRIDRDLIAVEL